MGGRPTDSDLLGRPRSSLRSPGVPASGRRGPNDRDFDPRSPVRTL